MLPLERTFRIVPGSLRERFWRTPEADAGTRDQFQLTVSPFENPSRLLHISGPEGAPATQLEDDLARAAYFATFPAID